MYLSGEFPLVLLVFLKDSPKMPVKIWWPVQLSGMQK